MRVVVDPNVLVAAAITDGVSARLLDHWLTLRSFEIVACPMLIAELRDVLGRDKFRRWITEQAAALVVGRIEHEAETWRDPVEIPESTPDPRTTTWSRCTATPTPTPSSRATRTSRA